MRSFRVEVRGHSYPGLWRLNGLDRLEVRSDYGTVWVDLDGRDPTALARELLAGMIPITTEGLRLVRRA